MAGDRLCLARLANRDAHRLQYARRVLAHRHLPAVELALLAAHGDEDGEREAAYLHHAEHVDDVADAARLHEEHALLAAEPRARDEPDAFLFGAERNRAHVPVFLAELDQALVAGVRYVADDAHAGGDELLVDL